MSVQSVPMPADPVTQILGSARVLQAYLECSDELQPHAKKMIAALNDPELDLQDRYLAAETLCEILFPYYHEGDKLFGYDLEKANELIQNHDLADDHPEAKALNESATALALHASEKESFASRLSQIMEKAGITQTDLAARAEVSQPAISLLLSRECRPQKRTVRRIANALGVPPQDLWPGFGDES